MQLLINHGDIQVSNTLTDHVIQSIGDALKHVRGNITRVEVHLRDNKQKRRGPNDRICTLEARLSGARPFAVEARGADIYRVVTEATAKLSRAVARKIEYRRQRTRLP